MKVLIIKQSQAGKPGDIKDVSAGYARNYLIPQGEAVKATDENVHNYQAKQAKQQEQQFKQDDKLESVAQKLDAQTVTVHASANDEGGLYAAVHVDDVLPAIKKQFGIDLSNMDVKVTPEIKQVGKHDIQLKVQDSKILMHLHVKPQDDPKK